MGLRSGWWLAMLVALQAGRAAGQEQDWGEGEPESEPPVQQRSFTDDPVHVMASAGFGTLVGFAGLTVGYNVHDRLELGAGVGVNASGLMGGPYVRLRPFTVARKRSRTLHAIAVDAGLSAGGYQYEESGAWKSTYHSDFALFLQLEGSWEMVKLGGFSLRAGGGWAALLNPGNVECQSAACNEPRRLLPVLLVQLGTVF